MKEKHSTTETVYISGPQGYFRALLIRPVDPAPAEGRPGVLWIHGGGYSMGMPEMAYFSRAISLVRKFGAIVLAPDYRPLFTISPCETAHGRIGLSTV